MVEQNFVCPFCEAMYDTKEGLAKHLKKCEAKPDIDDDDETLTSSEGVTLFKGDDDDKPVYHCPDCDYTSEKPFTVCPKCGCEVEFS